MAAIRRVLVTGGCGFVGANLVRYLGAHTDWKLRVLDDLRSGDQRHVDEGLGEVLIGDIGDAALLGHALEGV
ncbi:MAG: NAD-dependent epimerase/dehydratase family protein, partial [Actinomycetota bacterium]